ncbi:MAG: amidase, partial [Burkholderiales bacterium]
MPGASDLIPPQTGHALLSATAASAAIHAGTLTSEALVSACLERIAQREGEVQAWAFIDPELALA